MPRRRFALPLLGAAALAQLVTLGGCRDYSIFVIPVVDAGHADLSTPEIGVSSDGMLDIAPFDFNSVICVKPTPGTIFCDHFDNSGAPNGWSYPPTIISNSPLGEPSTTITDTLHLAEDGDRSLQPRIEPPSGSAWISYPFAPPLPTILFLRAWIYIPLGVNAAIELMRLRTADNKAVWLGWTPSAQGSPALQILTSDTTEPAGLLDPPPAAQWTCVKLELTNSVTPGSTTMLTVTVGANAPRVLAIDRFSYPFDTLILGQVSLVDVTAETSSYIDNLVVSSDDPGC